MTQASGREPGRGQPLIVDDAGEPFVARAVGDTGRATFGHIDLVAGGPAEGLNEAVEPRCFTGRYTGGGRAFREAEILGLAALLANPCRRPCASRAYLALRVELARTLGEIITRRFARATIDAGTLAPGLCCRPIRGADLCCHIVRLESTQDLRLVPTGSAGELGNGRASCLPRERIDEADAARGLLGGEAQHLGCVALALVGAGAQRLLGRDIAALDRCNLVAGEVTPAFHRADLGLGRGQIVGDHRFLVIGIGDELGEGRVGLSLADHSRRLELGILRRIFDAGCDISKRARR